MAVASHNPPKPVWEERVDPSSGRTYFVNNERQTTQWEEPPKKEATVAAEAAVAAKAAVAAEDFREQGAGG